MALTSQNHGLSTGPIDTTPTQVSGLLVAWCAYYVAYAWWRIVTVKVELRAVHMIPFGFTVVGLLAAVIGLGVNA